MQTGFAAAFVMPFQSGISFCAPNWFAIIKDNVVNDLMHQIPSQAKDDEPFIPPAYAPGPRCMVNESGLKVFSIRFISGNPKRCERFYTSGPLLSQGWRRITHCRVSGILLKHPNHSLWHTAEEETSGNYPFLLWSAASPLPAFPLAFWPVLERSTASAYRLVSVRIRGRHHQNFHH